MTKRGLCIDLPALLTAVQALSIEERARAMMLSTGCECWPGNPRIIQGPSARLAAIGGLGVVPLINAGLDANQIARMTRQSIVAKGIEFKK